MIKKLASKLTSISWGWGAACFALLAFIGLSVLPLAANPNDEKTRKHSVVGMMEKAAEKSREAKAMNGHGGHGKVEIKTATILPDGTVYAAGKMGLYRAADGQVVRVEGFPGHEEIKSLTADADGHLFTAGKDGVWRWAGGKWSRLLEGEVNQVQVGAQGHLVVAGKHCGVLISRDQGQTWSPVASEWASAAGSMSNAPCASSPVAMAK